MNVAPFADSRARRRDERLRTAVERTSRDLLAYFARRVDILEDAADLVSDTMLTAWRRIDDLPDSNEETRMWLFGVARRTLANHHRGRQRADANTELLRLELRAAQSAYRADDEGDASDLRDLVQRLPETQRDLVALVHWDGFSLVEAAIILDIPASTARSRYSAARASLRDTLTRADSTRR
ncbi:RNA polymerase sigma factor [Frondihabitans australicus]|uniref:RNA polymerase sigma-70 factor (ECF subfamily) n=1 Tax=Frondihabitans australicus TaxID=386892 RepID=A0A495IK07_9MICO|nr:RNA polymerase sigma factor [Frondihabitans australicus]RKR76304.1 RNA polymerase sigma-70 factor (ECF subfamily) [Frondihabitans australicus]